MANFRPAGLSDDDSEYDSEGYGFLEKPIRHYQPEQLNNRKKAELNLEDAILNCNLKEVEKVIACSFDNNVNIQMNNGWTPLMHACFHAQHKIVEFLLDKGADPNLHADSVTPIMAACSNSSAQEDTIYQIISDLINKGSILNIGDKHGQTPLMRAICSGRITVVQKLLDQNVNIEMRDQQGWTAIFWAVNHNQLSILQTLITHGARLLEVDRYNRTILDIAISHDYQDLIEFLNEYFKKEDEDDDGGSFINSQIKSWQDYYPGIQKGKSPEYVGEIPNLLYGMNCEKLTPLIIKSGMDLRKFLLMEENDMTQLGIDMPYQKQRLKLGLRNFHLRGWKLNAVSGLYAKKSDNFSVLDCLTTLGTHLQQVYLLEATLQYTLRSYNRIQEQIKFEPPDSPLILKLKAAAKKMLTNINSIRKEIQTMKSLLTKISRNNPQPADLIREKSLQDIITGYLTEAVVVCTVVVLAYNTKTLINILLKK